MRMQKPAEVLGTDRAVARLDHERFTNSAKEVSIESLQYETLLLGDTW